MAQQRPIHEIRLGNHVRAAIWSNQSEDRRTWFSVTITRRYKNGEQWKDSTSFRRDDLPVVAKVADIVKVGDIIPVEVIEIDELGRVNLSLKRARTKLGIPQEPPAGMGGGNGGAPRPVAPRPPQKIG